MKRALIIALLLPIALSAQVPFTIHSLHNIRLPQGLDNLSTIDDQLYGYNHLLVSTPISITPITSFQPDTIWAKLIPDADYIVRNPRDSMLYFTRCDADGTTNLYTLTPQRFRKIHRINIHGWQRDICHPTFSPNGRMMIFTSKGKVGLGGYDLWCSLWNGHRWTRPINLGNSINTPGDETNPVFYNNYLIFTSDSVPGGQPGNNLYALYLREATSIDEIIFGTYTIQSLPYPINSGSNDMNMAFHHSSSQGWWISSRSGKRELYSFVGQLAGVMLSGTASDTYNSPLPHANISIALDGRTVASTHTDSNGHYSLYVLPNDNYTLQASLDGYFNFEQPLPVARTNEQLLINSLLNDIQLTSLPLNRPKMLLNIFDHGANSELSTSGKTSLNSIIKFLRDNPNIHATIDIYCDQTYDDAYNNILIEQRINTLYQYLCTYLPSDRQFSIRNGNNADKIESSATGADLIFITLN